jgi:[ribosomal protein S5]-alanine N-acetyltransferase
MKTTARLCIRAAQPQDAGFYADLENDPEVKRFVGGPTGKSAEQYRHTLVDLGDNYRCLTVEYTGANLPIGRCGLIIGEGEIEMHYLIGKQYWKRRFGSEIANALIELSSEKFPNLKIVAKSHPENLGSISILRKLGLKQTSVISSADYDNGFLRFERFVS